MLQGPLPTTSSLGLKDAPTDINTSVTPVSTVEEQSDELDLDGINDEEIDQVQKAQTTFVGPKIFVSNYISLARNIE